MAMSRSRRRNAERADEVLTDNLVRNEVEDDPGTLNEGEQNENETECEICTVCDLIVTSDQEGIFCEGPCKTWFHRKCAKLTPRRFQQLRLSDRDWFCDACPSDLNDKSEQISWGEHHGLDKIKLIIKSAYQEISGWFKNLFFLPWGKTSRDFIAELTNLIELFNGKTPWEPVAIDMLHVFIPIMLQKPSARSKSRVNSKYLMHRLEKWKQGQLEALMSECREIQKRLKTEFKKRTESRKKTFCKLMFEGKISKALKFVDSESKISGVHKVTDAVVKSLEEKHPIAKPVDPACVVNGEIPKVEPVIFETIDGDLIQSVAKQVAGSGGPTLLDADGWKHILCCNNFKTVSSNLCQAIANMTKRLCVEDIAPEYLTSLLANRLIPLIKNVDGIRPIGIGEVLRRIMSKAVARLLKNDIIQATGSMQTCSGVEGGIEAAVHGIADAYNSENAEAILLVDATNAFNSLNRQTALLNLQYLCPPYYMFLNNCYKKPSKLYVSNSNEVLYSQEGTTQGDPSAMPFYAVSTRPLIDHLMTTCTADKAVTQCWYADDSNATGNLSGLQKWFQELCKTGPGYGYFPNEKKCVLIVKNNELAKKAKKIFKDFPNLKITTDGDRHLGAVIGSETFRDEYIKAKVDGWVEDVKQLAEIAIDEPQAAYSAFVKGLCMRWTYIQRTVSDIGHLFQPLEDAIHNIFIPAMLGKPVTPIERRILALPVRLGGLGIHDPTKTAAFEYSASRKITEGLKELIVRQNTSIEILDNTQVKKTKQELKIAKENQYKEELNYLIANISPLKQRCLELSREKSASSWLTALPLRHLGYTFNKQQFRDAICLRYNFGIQGIPKYCACGTKNDITHALTCKKGGYVTMRHNALRDCLANTLKEVCADVRVEPQLLPVNPNDYHSRTNTSEGARLDISAVGVLGSFERTYFDVRVSHPNAPSNVTLTLNDVYRKNEREKKDMYEERVINSEKGSFAPLVFLTTGGMGPECAAIVKRVAGMIANKRDEKYADVMNHIRTKLRFALLKSILIAVRGVRGRIEHDKMMGHASLNLAPRRSNYEFI